MSSGAIKLSTWERGVRLDGKGKDDMFSFLWFYEWHMFNAVVEGEHTRGSHEWGWQASGDGSSAGMDAGWLKLEATAAENGAELQMTIRNESGHDWPKLAAIIPCYNPGDPYAGEKRNALFLDEDHDHTYFFGENGLDLIKGSAPREIHFRHSCRDDVMACDKESDDGVFVWDYKWPTSDRDAYAGVMIRESSDGRYVMGIAWEDFLSAQGHNPWNCMHLSIKVGPLRQGDERTIRGKAYLIEGDKDDCLKAFERDFG